MSGTTGREYMKMIYLAMFVNNLDGIASAIPSFRKRQTYPIQERSVMLKAYWEPLPRKVDQSPLAWIPESRKRSTFRWKRRYTRRLGYLLLMAIYAGIVELLIWWSNQI